MSADKALRGGLAGAASQGFSVLSLMWMRTTMNYQYRYGGKTMDVIKHLYSQGGIPRFYRGLVPAMMQAPISRFGDTAANTGALALCDSFDSTRNLPVGVKTAFATVAASLFRIVLTPIDAWKTIKQVEGGDGLKSLIQKVRVHGITKLWHGAGATVAATAAGHFPWFFTRNYLEENLQTFDFAYGKTVRSACIGFSATVVSDTISNSLRVIKTTKQTSLTPLTYPQVVAEVVAKDGVIGLFGRGLTTRIATNGIQGMCFNVLWTMFSDMFQKKRD